MRQSKYRIIGSGLLKAVEAAANKEDRLHSKLMLRDMKWRKRFSNMRDKFLDLRNELRYMQRDNKRLRKAVHYLENLNGGLTERQTAKLEKVLGIPANIERSADWHKVADGCWRK